MYMTKEERSLQRKEAYKRYRSAVAFIRHWKPRLKPSRLRSQLVENYGSRYKYLLY